MRSVYIVHQTTSDTIPKAIRIALIHRVRVIESPLIPHVLATMLNKARTKNVNETSNIVIVSPPLIVVTTAAHDRGKRGFCLIIVPYHR